MVRIASTLDSEDVRVKSPYEDLRDLILIETDLVVKYNNISLFIQKYMIQLILALIALFQEELKLKRILLLKIMLLSKIL